MRCAVANCGNDNTNRLDRLSFFAFPSNKKLQKKWVKFCDRDFKFKPRFSHICMRHFKTEDIENNMKYEMGFAKSRRLRPNAVPTILNPVVETIEKEPNEDYKQIVDDLLRKHQNRNALEDIVDFTNDCNTVIISTSHNLPSLNSTSQQDDVPDGQGELQLHQQTEETEKFGLINEALFDHEEITKHQNDEIDNAIPPSPTSIEIKTEEDDSFLTNDDEAYQFPNSKSTQTDEAAEDRINCGFINISKTGVDKYFNLRCFYCEAEYPISFWSEFSDHILYNHGHLEKDYGKKEFASNASAAHSNIDLIDSGSIARIEKPSLINFVDLNDIASMRAKPSSSIEQTGDTKVIEFVSADPDTINADDEYLYAETYMPNIEHSYSQSYFNEKSTEKSTGDKEALDEICIEKTPRNIVIDFLEHLKGFPSLWHNRKLDSGKYDFDLQNLMNLMKTKWNLKLRMHQLRKDLENIKSWFHSFKEMDEMSEKDVNTQRLLQEYYEKCAEYLHFEYKQNKFVCDICNRTISSAIRLHVHKYRKHQIGQLPYRCSKCNRRFVYIQTMLRHLKTHKEDMPTNEEKKPTRRKRKMEPIEDHTTAFKCYECNKGFDCPNEYKLHLDIHPHGERKYACEECGKRFKDDTQRKTHVKTVHISTGRQCPYCPIKLADRAGFKAHTNTHKGIYELVCEWCGLTCVTRKYYREHCLYAHLGRGLCKICNREFKLRGVLQMHLANVHRPLIGTNEELSKRCGPTQVEKQYFPLIKYEFVIDPLTQTRRVKCPKCDKNFVQKKAVRAHALRKHNYNMLGSAMKGTQQQQKLKRPRRQSFTSKGGWKRIKRISNYTIDTNIEEEEATADNAIKEECSVMEAEISVTNSNDTAIEVNEIEDYRNATEISLAELVGDIGTIEYF